MPVQFRLNQETGEIWDVKPMPPPRSNSQAIPTGKLRTCEFCGKAVKRRSIYQHKKSQKCLLIQQKKQEEAEKQKKQQEEAEKQARQKQSEPEPDTFDSLASKIIAMCKQLGSFSFMD